MLEREAAELWGRMIVHFPALGGDTGDPIAKARASDWISTLERYELNDGRPVSHSLHFTTNLFSFPLVRVRSESESKRV